jgi:hypothetical protein
VHVKVGRVHVARRFAPVSEALAHVPNAFVRVIRLLVHVGGSPARVPASLVRVGIDFVRTVSGAGTAPLQSSSIRAFAVAPQRRYASIAMCR